MNLRLILFPISVIYGSAVFIRNKLFDWGFKKEVLFDVPIISVGNITVGGTGKTPHIEFLLQALSKFKQIAVVSRGYKRKTQGFVLAQKNSTPETIGDEPYQIFRKYPKTRVAVCEKRATGIQKLLDFEPHLDVVLLDDAYQHRYVKPGLSILLIDYNRPIFTDYILPAGNLRESRKGSSRANIVMVTKVPDRNKINRKFWKQKLKLKEHQSLFFSTYTYGNIQALFSKKNRISSVDELVHEKANVLLVTGIAEPTPLLTYLGEKGLQIELLKFSDHHNFTHSDLVKIKTSFNAIDERKKIILTTEKDAVRFKYLKEYPQSLKDKTYYLPIQVEILENKQKEFEKKITKYVKQS